MAKLQKMVCPKTGRRDAKNVRVETETGCNQKWTKASGQRVRIGGKSSYSRGKQ